MGAGQQSSSQSSSSNSQSYSKSTSKAVSSLSSLANTQESIVKSRESLFNDFYVPEMKGVIEGFDPDSASGQAQMGLTANEINASFDSAQKQTGQMLARQNLGGTGAGAALTAANNRARSSALASAYANQMASSNANKAQTLASFGALMPQTTTAAPVVNKAESQSVSESSSSTKSRGSESGWKLSM